MKPRSSQLSPGPSFAVSRSCQGSRQILSPAKFEGRATPWVQRHAHAAQRGGGGGGGGGRDGRHFYEDRAPKWAGWGRQHSPGVLEGGGYRYGQECSIVGAVLTWEAAFFKGCTYPYMLWD